MGDRNLGTMGTRVPNLRVKCADGSFYDHRAHEKDEKRVLIEVDVHPTNGCVIGGQHVKQGVHRVVIYQSELDQVMGRVATPEQIREWKVAEDIYRANLAAYLDREAGKDDGTEKRRALREAAAQRYGESTTSLEFQRRDPAKNRRGRPPITRLDIIDADVDAPETEANREAKRLSMLITSLADMMVKRETAGSNKRAAG